MKLCLIGKKLGHSFSAVIHNSCGLNYILNEVQPNDLDGFLKNCPFDGFNVTIPYKKDVIKYMSWLSSEATGIGAVNVVKNVNGKLYGYNTDYNGLEYSYNRKGVSVRDKNVLVLGSGGASATAVYHAKTNGAKSVTVVSRTGSVNYTNVYKLQQTNVIVNTTPVGMCPNNYEKVIDLSKFGNLEAVVDFIYNPNKTAFMCEAESLGIKVVDGLSILVEQALSAQDIWLNKTHTSLESEEMILNIKKLTLNAVLIGMPSCGKSTVGKLFSETLNKKFVDVDEEFFKTYNYTPSQYILKFKEPSFRDKEEELIKELSKITGAVISCGGGVVERQANVKNLKMNGVIIYVKRSLDKLILDDRPISKNEGIERLYQKRKDKYELFSDVQIENNGDINNAVKEAVLAYETSCNKRG